MTQFWWKYLRRYCSQPVFGLRWPWSLTFDPKAYQNIYEPKYICDQTWLKFPLLGCEIWCSQGFGSLPAVTLTFNLLIPKANQHINEFKYICDQNWAHSFHCFWDIVFTRFFSHCLMRPWPLTSKANQHIYEPKYICDRNWAKFPL